jgi:hypothetical protein
MMPVVGFRQRFLLLTGAAFIGIGAVVWYETAHGRGSQLPIDSLTDVSGYVVAGIWLGAGAVVAGLGWWPPADRWVYALAAAAAAWWAGAWVVQAIRFSDTGDWGSAVVWLTVALMLLLVSGWPEPS